MGTRPTQFGNALKRMRRDILHLTQEELADKIASGTSTIGNAETGALPGLDLVLKLEGEFPEECKQADLRNIFETEHEAKLAATRSRRETRRAERDDYARSNRSRATDGLKNVATEILYIFDQPGEFPAEYRASRRVRILRPGVVEDVFSYRYKAIGEGHHDDRYLDIEVEGARILRRTVSSDGYRQLILALPELDTGTEHTYTVSIDYIKEPPQAPLPILSHTPPRDTERIDLLVQYVKDYLPVDVWRISGITHMDPMPGERALYPEGIEIDLLHVARARHMLAQRGLRYANAWVWPH